jgi:hypothetical protein
MGRSQAKGVCEQSAEEWDEVIGGWRKVHSEELHNLYSSRNISKIFNCWVMHPVARVSPIF